MGYWEDVHHAVDLLDHKLWRHRRVAQPVIGRVRLILIAFYARINLQQDVTLLAYIPVD